MRSEKRVRVQRNLRISNKIQLSQVSVRSCNLDIDHLNVMTAFLQGDVNEEIYVRIPVIDQKAKTVK